MLPVCMSCEKQQVYLKLYTINSLLQLFIQSTNIYGRLHVPAPALGMEIIRTGLHGVYIFVVEAVNKKRKQIKGIISEHNIALRDIKQGDMMVYESHWVYGMDYFR